METRITNLFGIEYPIIQGGMIWCSGWKLASAVSNAGGLGIIGAGSMYPDVLREHIQKCKKATKKPFAVNLPLIYPEIEKLISIIVEEDVKIVFTSAGNPKKFTHLLRSHNITVVHVVANIKFAQKSEQARVDAIVAEGYEAGGHNGYEENTTMTLIPRVCKAVKIPVIAAGGIASGEGLLAALALGADAVQMGTRFVVSEESSAHQNFKQAVLNSFDGHTMVHLKKLIPVRLLRNPFSEDIKALEDNGGTKEELEELLGTARAKKGMFEGDIIDGELEIGQIAASINEIEPVRVIINKIMLQFDEAKKRFQ